MITTPNNKKTAFSLIELSATIAIVGVLVVSILTFGKGIINAVENFKSKFPSFSYVDGEAEGPKNMWLIGGRDGAYKNDIWNSKDGENWTQVTTSGTIFSGRSYHQTLVFNNKIWVIGGYLGGATYEDDVWSSDDGVNWTQVTPSGTIFSARHHHQALVYKNKIWVIGGSDGTNKNDV